MSYFKIAACAAAFLAGAASVNLAQAGSKGGASPLSPGHEVSAPPTGLTPTTGNGASEWAPGRLEQSQDKFGTNSGVSGPGASEFAPGDSLSHSKK